MIGDRHGSLTVRRIVSDWAICTCDCDADDVWIRIRNLSKDSSCVACKLDLPEPHAGVIDMTTESNGRGE